VRTTGRWPTPIGLTRVWAKEGAALPVGVDRHPVHKVLALDGLAAVVTALVRHGVPSLRAASWSGGRKPWLAPRFPALFKAP
jgi:hypothetical protein